MRKNILPWVLAALLGAGYANAGGVEMVVSIKPLQLIAKAVTTDMDKVHVLLPPGATMHHYSLKPSDLGKLEKANIMLWLGPRHEPYLAKIAAANRAEFSVVAVNTGSDDPHTWMSPTKAVQIARQLVQKLKTLNPEQADQYEINLHNFEKSLSEMNEDIRRFFTGASIRYVVYHDAYGYFEQDYDLKHFAVVSRRHDVKPGARQLLKLRRLIKSEKIACLLTMPDSNPGIIRVLTDGNSLTVRAVDPLAAGIEPQAGGYVKFIRYVAQAINECGAVKGNA